MNRCFLTGRCFAFVTFAALLAINTGCLHHQTRGGCTGGCASASCDTGVCSTGSCQTCQSQSCGDSSDCHCQSCGRSEGGLMGKCRGRMMGCHTGCRTGCVAGPLGWQQGGHDYSSHLSAGVCGHRAATAMQNRPFTPGAPTAQVAYPYYTHRGPRDFLVNNPPSIGP
ncbi:MAG: hypothetical protein AAF539_09865 [Planctomycetota bacterium]